MIILGTNSIKAAGGFNVANSLRFNDGSSDSLTKTPSGAGNRRTWTYSTWLKRTTPNGFQSIMGADAASQGSGYSLFFSFDSTNELIFGQGDNTWLKTNQLFRDPSAFYHILLAVDTTNGTANNRVRMYINGSEVTSFGTRNNPSQNYEMVWNNTVNHSIGADFPNSGLRNFFDGYMCETVNIDGQQLAPDQFGEFDDSGIWKPIDVSGLTFGNNGFYLDFEDSSALGNDAAGSNNFTVNNLTAIDQSIDSCTNNFATLNSLLPTFSSTFTEGNLKWTPSTASQYYWSNSTFGLSQGKWYMEAKLTTAADHNVIGLSNDSALDDTSFLAGTGGEGDANIAYQYGYKSSNGQVYNNASGSSYGNTYTTNDIIGLYLDLDNNKLYFAKNGTVQNSGTGVSITDPGSIPGGVYFLAVADGTSSNASVWEVNFGGTNTYSISSGNTDDNGYGNFEYSPNITGDSVAKKFYALNTKNLAEFG